MSGGRGSPLEGSPAGLEARPAPEQGAFVRPGLLRRKCRTVPRGFGASAAPPPTPHRRLSGASSIRRRHAVSPVFIPEADLIFRAASGAGAAFTASRRKRQAPARAVCGIPKLRFVRPIGAGFFASVALFREERDVLDDVLPRFFAVKENKDAFESEHTASYKQMLRSTLAWARLEPHPGIVPIYCAWKEHGRVKIQMEFCQGGNLLEYVEHCLLHASSLGWQPEVHLCRCLFDALSGLAHIHSHDLCHNDIKPGNMFLGGVPLRLMLGDFGHLRKKDDDADGDEGDVRYIPKEMLNGHFSPAGDVFMLGISFYEVIADVELPTTGAWHDLRQGKVPPLPPGLPEQVFHVLKRMMHPNPGQRPTAKELLETEIIKRYSKASLPQIDLFARSAEDDGDEDENKVHTPEQGPTLMHIGTPKEESPADTHRRKGDAGEAKTAPNPRYRLHTSDSFKIPLDADVDEDTSPANAKLELEREGDVIDDNLEGDEDGDIPDGVKQHNPRICLLNAFEQMDCL